MDKETSLGFMIDPVKSLQCDSNTNYQEIHIQLSTMKKKNKRNSGSIRAYELNIYARKEMVFLKHKQPNYCFSS